MPSSADELVSLGVDNLNVVDVDGLVSSIEIPIDVPATVVCNRVLVVEIFSAVVPADVYSDKMVLVSSVFSSNFVDIVDVSVVISWFKVDISIVDCVDDTDIVDDDDVFSVETGVVVADGKYAVVVDSSVADEVFKNLVVKFSLEVVSVEKSAVVDGTSAVDIVVSSVCKTEDSGSFVTKSVVDPFKFDVLDSGNSVSFTNFAVVSFWVFCSISIVVVLSVAGLSVGECDVISPVYKVEGSLCRDSVTVVNVSIKVEDIKSSVDASGLDAVVCVVSTSGIEVVVGEFVDKVIVSVFIAVGCSVEVDVSDCRIVVVSVIVASVVVICGSSAVDSVVKGVVVDCSKNVVVDISDVVVCSIGPLIWLSSLMVVYSSDVVILTVSGVKSPVDVVPE